MGIGNEGTLEYSPRLPKIRDFYPDFALQYPYIRIPDY